MMKKHILSVLLGTVLGVSLFVGSFSLTARAEGVIWDAEKSVLDLGGQALPFETWNSYIPASVTKLTIQNGTLTDGLSLSGNDDITLNNITIKSVADENGQRTGLTIEDGATCVINSGIYEGQSTVVGANLVINGGEFAKDIAAAGGSQFALAVAQNSSVTINNGTFDTTLFVWDDFNGNLNIVGGTFNTSSYVGMQVLNNPSANIKISGGSFQSSRNHAILCTGTADPSVIMSWLVNGAVFSDGAVVVGTENNFGGQAGNYVFLQSNMTSVVAAPATTTQAATTDNVTAQATATAAENIAPQADAQVVANTTEMTEVKAASPKTSDENMMIYVLVAGFGIVTLGVICIKFAKR